MKTGVKTGVRARAGAGGLTEQQCGLGALKKEYTRIETW